MPRTYKREPGSRRYADFTSENLENALKAMRAGMGLRKASRDFKVPKGTLANRYKGLHSKPFGGQVVFNNDEENAFVEHMRVVAEWGFPFDTFDLRVLAKTYLDKVGRVVSKFKNNYPSRDWANNFLARHKDKITLRTCQNIKTARAKVSSALVNEYFDNLTATLSDIPHDRIFNYDETNLSDNPGLKKCIFKRGTKYPERIRDSSKAAISIMYCGSAAGQMLPSYVVYKSEHLWSTWTENGPKNTRYNRTKSGWFDATTFTDWFSTIFIPHVKNIKGRKCIIGDNLSSHFTDEVLDLAEKNDIAFICLPPNSTHLLQPLDVAFYGPLKKQWRKILDDYKLRSQKAAKNLSKDIFPSLLLKLEAAIFSSAEYTSQNIVSGFKKCGIHPLDRSKVLDRLPDKDGPVNVNESVSDVMVGMLSKWRGVDGEQARPRKRRKLDVPAGKSISRNDLNNNQPTEPLVSEADSSTSDLDEDHSASSEDESSSDDDSEKIEKSSVTVDTYVVVAFEGSNFPGRVTAINESHCTVSVMCKCQAQGWYWPDRKDELPYPWVDVVRVLTGTDIVPLNNRGAYRIKAMEAEWGI